MCIRQEASVETIYSAPVSRALFTFCSAMAVEMGSFFTEKVPPKPQHTSESFISLSSKPLTLASRARGSDLIPYSRKAAQAS